MNVKMVVNVQPVLDHLSQEPDPFVSCLMASESLVVVLDNNQKKSFKRCKTKLLIAIDCECPPEWTGKVCEVPK
jgi:hypothetical protein